MADLTSTPGKGPGSAAANAVAPDPLTADLLKKHAAGEKLTPADYGKLGAWKAKLKSLVTGGGRPPVPATAAASSSPALPPPGTGPVVASNPAPDGSAGSAPVDPDLVRRTTAAILTTCEGIACSWIVTEARKAGADEITARQFERAAALQQGPRELMIQTSPEVLASMGVNAGNYPVTAFLTGMGVWAGSLMVAVNKLKAMQEERQRLAPAAPESSSHKGQPIPPARDNPPGAPPMIT